MARYAAAIPLFVWVCMLYAGADVDATRKPYLIAQCLSIIVTVWANRRDFTRLH